ncbi:hypothetical protein THZG08_140004 [Vibrio owensii]|nr:hypothetical protein THZG08_140004 [Vibrio owensii]CAH1552341.1 hypothetical protein THOA03_150004 [Vibrio owensii]
MPFAIELREPHQDLQFVYLFHELTWLSDRLISVINTELFIIYFSSLNKTPVVKN